MARVSFSFILLCIAIIHLSLGAKDSSQVKSKVATKDEVVPKQSPEIVQAKKDVQASPLGAKEGSKEKSNEVTEEAPTSNHVPGQMSTKTDNHDGSSKKGHILIFHNAGTRSHLIALNALTEGLLNNGHRVTLLAYAKSNLVHQNYKELIIKDR